MTSTMLVQMGSGPLGVLVKATILLSLAGIAAFALMRASAAIRHAIWLGGLVAALGLVVALPFAPRLDVRVRTIAPVASGVGRSGMPLAAGFSSAPKARRAITTSVSDTRRIVDRRTHRDGIAVSWSQLAALVWLTGALLVIARTLLAHRVVGRIVRNARELPDTWSSGAVFASNVRILMSDEISGPVTAGVIDPVVIVPSSAADWSPERRAVVLAHELAHVSRLDFASQLIASIACALFWFHPLVWFAAARLRAEAELAADDRVLVGGVDGVSYASHLLDLARVDTSMRLSAAVAVGMVRASRLEGRVRAMLDLDRSRTAVPARMQAVAASLTLAAMVPIAGLRAVTRPLYAPKAVAMISQIATTQQIAADSSFEKTIDAKSGDVLTLDLETGGDVTVRGWDEQQIKVRGMLSGRDWRDTRVTLERWSRGVRLRSEFDGRSDERSTRHTFEIWVPKKVSVDLRSSGGSLAINDVTGEFRGHTGGGSMMITGATGSARLSTGGGNVRVTNSDLSGTVSTGGGEVLIANVTGGLRATSGSGPVIRVPGVVEGGTSISGGFGGGATTTSISGTAGGFGGGTGRAVGSTVSSYGSGASSSTITSSGVTTNVSSTISDRELSGIAGGYVMSRAGGSIELSEAAHGGRFSTGGGNIYIGSANAMLSVSTGGGEIELPRVGGSVSAWTGAGDVTITVVDGDGPAHSVDVFTGKGTVVLELPSNLDARFELETAYTESRRPTQIESAIPLSMSETNDWDSSQGTPRRYVRATGSVGNGKGLIRVRAVNGDIIVRRGR